MSSVVSENELEGGELGDVASVEGSGSAMSRAERDILLCEFAAARVRADRSGAVSVGGLGADDSDDDFDSGSAGTKATVDEEAVEVRQREFGELEVLAERMRRFSNNQLLNVFAKGRIAMAGPTMVSGRAELRFCLGGTETIMSLGDVDALIDRMRREVVVTHVMARTGIGKSTVIPGRIAKQLGARVLLLVPTRGIAVMAERRLRAEAEVRHRWLKVKEESVTVMTYMDFWGHHCSRNGEKMMEQFDVFMLDEAHRPTADVRVAKGIVALYGSSRKFSILLCTATMENEDTQALNEVAPVIPLVGSLMAMAKDGVLFSKSRLKDRTMLIVASDSDAAEMFQMVQAEGLTAAVLDSASRPADVERVFEQLQGQSTNFRYVIVTEEYGTGTNLPVSQLYTDATRVVCRMDSDNDIHIERIPITASEVKQHAARVGRCGARKGSVYVFNHEDRGRDVEILNTERFKAFLMLRAVGIVPLRDLLPDRSFIPFGITPTVALQILSINLPPEVAIRYFNADGALPVPFVKALAPFSHLEHYAISSASNNPVGEGTWVNVQTGGVYGMSLADRATVRVPIVVEDDELNAKLQIISALSYGYISLERYLPSISEDEASGDDAVLPVRAVQNVRMPRLIVNAVKPLPMLPKQRWVYDVTEADQVDISRMIGGGSLHGSHEVTVYNDSELVEDVPLRMLQVEQDHRGNDRVKIPISSNQIEAGDITLRTPGGTTVAMLRAGVWDKLVHGERLSHGEAVSLFKAIKYTVKKFAQSEAFANWNNAWLGVLRTLGDEDTVESLARHGMVKVAIDFLMALYVRYGAGVENIVSVSYVRSKFWDRIVSRKRSITVQLERDKRRGNVEVLQSEKFLKRLNDIRVLAVAALEVFEKKGYFDQSVATMLQGVQPVKLYEYESTSRDEVLRATRSGKSSKFSLGR